MPITDYLRDFVLVLEYHKAVQIFPCRKIDMRRIANFSVILFLKLEIL